MGKIQIYYAIGPEGKIVGEGLSYTEAVLRAYENGYYEIAIRVEFK